MLKIKPVAWLGPMSVWHIDRVDLFGASLIEIFDDI
jgi:hypothetical protein